MARTSQRELSQMVTHMENVTGLSLGIEHAYGAPRLVSGDGSREVSPRLPSGQLLEWMRAFMRGFDAARRPDSPTWAPIYKKGNPRPRRTRRRMGLIKDMRFFRKHGGGVVGEAARGALDLTRAEREMKKRGWTVEWVPDDGADWSWLDQPGFEKEKAREHEVYGAVLKDRRGNVLASLWGIFDPDQKYQRVVEAELASEALSGR